MTPGIVEGWRVDLCSIREGVLFPEATVLPRNFSFSQTLSGFGRGSITVATRQIRGLNFLPAETVFAISRTSGFGASPLAPKVEFVGLSMELFFNSSGSVTWGLHGLDLWLDRAALGAPRRYSQVAQEQILASAINDWVPAERRPAIFGRVVKSGALRDRSYQTGQRVGSALKNMSDVIGGPEFRTVYEETPDGNSYRGFVEIADAFSGGDGFLNDMNSTIAPRMSALGRSNWSSGFSELDLEHDTGDDEAPLGFGTRTALTRNSFAGRDAIMLADSPNMDTDISYGTVAETLEGVLSQGRLAQLYASAATSARVSRDTNLIPGESVFVETSSSGVRFETLARVTDVSWTLSPSSSNRQVSLSLPGDTPIELVG